MGASFLGMDQVPKPGSWVFEERVLNLKISSFRAILQTVAKANQWYFEISSDRAKYGNNKKFLASWNWIVPKILHYAFLHILIIVMNGYHQTMALLFHYFCGNFFPNFGLPRWQSRLKIANKIAKVSKPRFRGFLVFGMYTQTSIWWTSVSDPFFRYIE